MWRAPLGNPTKSSMIARSLTSLSLDSISSLIAHAPLFGVKTLSLFDLYSYITNYMHTPIWAHICALWEKILPFNCLVSRLLAIGRRKVTVDINMSNMELNFEMSSALMLGLALTEIHVQNEVKNMKELTKERRLKFIENSRKTASAVEFYFHSFLRQLYSFSLSLSLTVTGGTNANAALSFDKICCYVILPTLTLAFPSRNLAHLENYSSPSSEIRTYFNEKGQTVISVIAHDKTVEKNLRSVDMIITNPITTITYSIIVESLEVSLFPTGRAARSGLVPIMPPGAILVSCNMISVNGPFWVIFDRQLSRFVDLDIVWLGDDVFENRIAVENYLSGLSNSALVSKLTRPRTFSEVSEVDYLEDDDETDEFSIVFLTVFVLII